MFAALFYFSKSSYAYMGYCSKPTEPYCINMLSASKDEYTFSSCRRTIKQYLSEIESYLNCRINEVNQEQDELRDDSNSVIRKFNCYAEGGSYCY
jgi:hypothetical protein